MSKWVSPAWIGIGLVGLMGVTFFFGFHQHPSSFDDAYITYRYARNIALGRGFVYNIGESVLGTTTPLYTLILAGLSFIWRDIPLLSHYIGVLAWMLCIPVIYSTGKTGGRETVGMIAAAFVALNALFLSCLGMETTLYVLLVLLTFYFYMKEQMIWASLCAGLTYLTRWDGILVVGVLLFVGMLKREYTFPKKSLVFAFVVVPWLVYSYVTFGSIFPNTFFAKLGQGWNQGLGGAEIGPFGRGLLLIATSAYEHNNLFLFLPIFALIGLFDVFCHKIKWWPLLLWAMTYIGGFVALGVLRFGWYYTPLVPVFLLLTAKGIEVVAQFLSFYLRWRAVKIVLVVAFFAICLVPNVDWLVKRQKTVIAAHTTTYLEVGRWLKTHTSPDSSVAMIEIGIIGFYSDRFVVDTMGLVSPEMVGHLGTWLQTLQFAVNYYWPDYIVALERTAWSGVVHEPWFEESYVLETQIENSADPVAPVHIYSRRNGFPQRNFTMNSLQNMWVDQSFVLKQTQVALDCVRQGDSLHVQLTWNAQADIHIDYRLKFNFLNISNGQLWTLASGLQPMQGGNPTSQWRRGDHILDRHSLRVPADATVGSYMLQLLVIGKDGPIVMSDSSSNQVDYVVIGPIQISEGLEITKQGKYFLNELDD